MKYTGLESVPQPLWLSCDCKGDRLNYAASIVLIAGANRVLIPLLILIVGLTPSLISLWVMRQSDARAQARLQLALNSLTTRNSFSAFRATPDLHYIRDIGLVIGDFTCQFNARSSHIRCAINPSGPCDGCFHYAPKDFGDDQEAIAPSPHQSS